MKLNPITDQITSKTTMKQLIIEQKGNKVGTNGMDSVFIEKTNDSIHVQIKKANSDFDKVTSAPAKRQGFMGRIHDNLTQLFPKTPIFITWYDAFDEIKQYSIQKEVKN